MVTYFIFRSHSQLKANDKHKQHSSASVKKRKTGAKLELPVSRFASDQNGSDND